MATLIGVDVGTSGTRALAVTTDGELVAEANRPHELLTPRPGWSEQDPGQWWDAAQAALAEVAAAAEDVVGLGLTGQMHGSVFLDSAGDVIRPALLWNDQRTAAECAEITERVGAERLLEIAGNPALTGFQAPKVLWLARHEPDAYARVASVLLPKDYVRLRLTGEHATDASDAAGTLLLDVRARDWSPAILDALEIPRAWMPAVHEGPEVTGTVRDDLAAELGLPRGLPVAAGGGDNAAAAVGVGVVREGSLSSSIGTSGVIFSHRDAFAPDPSGRVHAFCHAVPSAWHLMSVTLSAGGSLSWWRDQLGGDFDALVGEAEAVEAGAEGLVFLPYLTGERTPHLDPDARGGFVGLTVRHGRGHLTRAVMEGVAFSMRDGLEIMRDLGTPDDDVRAVGGGARSPLWLQLQADVYGRAIRRTVIDEGPAYGAALLAGVAAGAFADVNDAAARVRLREEVTEPDPERARRYEELYGVYASLYPALRDAMHALAG
ncbi:MAG TPA: xylulokinase [Solirubrobacteraceae bacterium]|jgi:xylulokinase